MSETRKLAAILVSDIVGYSRLAGADEDRILARLRTLRSDLIDPTIAVHHGRIVKRTGDGSIIEFRSVVDAVRCAIESAERPHRAQHGSAAGKAYRVSRRHSSRRRRRGERRRPHGRRRQHRRAARRHCQSGAICLSEDAYRQVKQRLDLKVTDLGATQLKNIAEPIHVYSLEVGQPAQAKPDNRSQANPPPPKARGLLRRARRHRRPSHSGRRRRLGHVRRPADETGAGAASFHRRAALRQSLGRSGARLFRRRNN